MNVVVLVGNLTRDPNTRYTASGTAVSNFGLAVNRVFADKKETTFVDIECWGKTAEFAGSYLTKGRQVAIQGRLKQDSWEDKTSGEKRTKLVVVAETVNFVGAKPTEDAGKPVNSAGEAPDDDVPF